MGPLAGTRIIELAGIGPAPFAAMLLADLGAEVVRIDRREDIDIGLPVSLEPRFDVLSRGRRSIAVDIKSEAGRNLVLRLASSADALIEGFRPGVMERLGLGPDPCLAANPRLVYGRMTGYGQDGPLAPRAGHDINYIAIAGVLHAIGSPDEPPVPPANLIGDFGGGGMFLALGVVSALLAAQKSGRGQVVDAAMVDGSAYLMSLMYGLFAAGKWRDERRANILDGAAPWYRTYATRDGKSVAVGAIEGRFYRELVRRLGLEGEVLPGQHDRAGWAELARRFAEVFASRTRSEWEAVFADGDACVTPVLSLSEAAQHPHNRQRGVFFEQAGVVQPAPAPRFSATPASPGALPSAPGADTRGVLADWGFTAGEIERLEAEDVVGRRSG
ncbi:MAG: CoA transferase [Hyphomicrobiaceae bacterium]|nr:CoA transferase [Hyphomicrobiaceae bacterium]